MNSDRGNEYFRWDAWASALSGYCEHRFLLTQCPTAVFHAWPVVQARLSACSSFVDPKYVSLYIYFLIYLSAFLNYSLDVDC